MQRKKERARKRYVRIVAVAGIMTLLNGMVSYAGTWEKQLSDWAYIKDDGQYAKYEWIQDTDGAWYYFGRFGSMETNQAVDGYYVGPDGKMIDKADTKNPLAGEKIYGICYMKADSYQDCGSYYLVNATLYDSSFGTNEDLSGYQVGDRFWIEGENAFGTVSMMTISTSGNVGVTVTYGETEYFYTPTSTMASTPSAGSEALMVRKIKDNVTVTIPKNIEIVPVPDYRLQTTLEGYLNSPWFKMTPQFNGTTVEKLYDDIINYAG